MARAGPHRQVEDAQY